MSRQPSIVVTIAAGQTGQQCQGQCGLDFSSKTALDAAAQALRASFGNRVKLERIEPAALESRLPPEIRERLRRGELNLPLLMVNGKVRISGYFDLRAMRDVVEAEIEMTAR